MTQFFFRHGETLNERDNANVVLGSRGDSGYMSRAENCGRCGGQGGSPHWRPDGGVCYQCNGRRTITRTYRVFTAEKLAKLVRTADAKDARKQAEREAAQAAKHVAFQRWSLDNENLLDAIKRAKGNPFMGSLASQLSEHKILSDKQLTAAEDSIRRGQERDVSDAASDFVGTVGERITFDAKVVGVYSFDTAYGTTMIVRMTDSDDNIFVWFATSYPDLERGDHVTLTGTIKDHDEYRGAKQTVLTRCKFDKFKIMTPDEAANAEVLA